MCGLALPAWAETQINARGWTHEKFGRLVLDTAAPLVKSAVIKDHKLVVEFSGPVTIRLGDALSKLGTYVERTPDAKGSRLVLPLLRPVTLHQFVDGNNFVVDFNRAKEWPSEKTAAAKEAEKKTEPAKPTGSGSGPKIVARQGEHAGYFRIAFDWPKKTDYRVERRDGMVVLSFERPATIDLAAVHKDVPGDLLQIAARDDGVARIYLTLAKGATLRDFRVGSTVVLDIVKPAKLTTAAKPLKLPSTVAASPAQSTPKDKEQPKAGAAAEQPAATAPGSEVAKLPTVPALPEPAAEAPAEPSPQLTLQSLPDLPQPAAPKAEASDAAEPPPPMPKVETVALPPRAPVNVQVVVAAAGGGAKITFTWPEPVAAAAFRRDGALYLAFDQPSNSLSALFEDARVARLGQASKLDIPDTTVIAIREDKPLGVALTATGRSWIADIAPDGKMQPRSTIEQRRETLADGAASLLLTTSKPGRVVALPPAASGEQLLVVPVRPAGHGVAAEVDWPEFKLLPSYQGIAIAARAGAVTIESLDQGVVVTTRPLGALAPIAEAPAAGEAPLETAEVTASEPEKAGDGAAAGEKAEPTDLLAQLDEEDRAAEEAASTQGAEGGNGLESVPGLFDLPSWRRGGEATFRADRAQLEAAVGAADDSEIGPARLALAQFYFAHGLLDEAASALQPVTEVQATKANPQQLHLLKAALQALDGDAEKAKAALTDRDLAEAPETALFLGLLEADAEDWPAAAKRFSGKLPNIADYPKPVRNRLYIAGAEALANGGNPIGAQRFADALRQDQPDKEVGDWLTYLDGLIDVKIGKRDDGLARWATLADSEVDEVKARSQFALVEERLAAGEMKPGEAIAPLERLRFVFRGGDFEFNLLRKLGGLYIAENQPRKGLVTLRQLAASFPNRPESKDIAEEMSRTFRGLYLENGADRLSPLVAVALYDEFRELTPAGADGDRMITLLTDRLVKVDLLDRAAELLDGQVKKRLTGLDKASAGTRLAAIQMLDQRPDLALQALKDSEIDEPLPPEIAAERRRLAARATFDSGDTLTGVQMLAEDDSLDAKWLRADMLWRTREWPAAATALGELIAGEEQALADERSAAKAKLDVTKDPAVAIDSAAQEEALKAEQDKRFKERIAPIILNRAIALSLASDRRALKTLAKDYGERMAGTDQEKAFAMLTAPDNGLVESVTAEMAGVERIDAFVTEYREKLKAQSLSEPAAGGS